MKNSTKNMIVAGVGGVAVGALLGVLFAPAEGKKTRAKIKDKTNEFTEAAKEKASAIADKVSSTDPNELLASLKSSVEEKYKEGKSEAKDVLLTQIQKLEEAIQKS
ncbi:MAG: YtxH domain-containing protein [Crocinitomicaceae bacterium]